MAHMILPLQNMVHIIVMILPIKAHFTIKAHLRYIEDCANEQAHYMNFKIIF